MTATWRTTAACRGEALEEYVPIRPGNQRGRGTSLQRCKTCPVKARCLIEALEIPEWSLGVWGGTTVAARIRCQAELRDLVRRRGDVRASALWGHIAESAVVTADVIEAIEATPARALAIAAGRTTPSVIVAVALLARGEEAVTETLVRRRDVAGWVLDQVHETRRALDASASQRCAEDVPGSKAERTAIA